MIFRDFEKLCRGWKQQSGARREACIEIYGRIQKGPYRPRYRTKRYLAMRLDELQQALAQPLPPDDDSAAHKTRVEQRIDAYAWLKGLLDEEVI